MNNSFNKGYIKLHRRILDWEWYTDINTKILFFHLLLKANHKDCKYRGKLIKKGSLITGRELLSKEVGLTVQQIRTSLNKLKLTSEITIESTSNGSLINLVNYGVYQMGCEKSNQQNNRNIVDQSTNDQPASNQQVTTNNNEKNIKNENNPPISPQGEKGNFSFVRREVKFISNLEEKSLQRAKTNSPGWDIYNLARIYLEGLEDRGYPDSFDAAFPAWCANYTKLKRPA